MNDLNILMKTKEILGDYTLLCQNTNISIPDFITARREAVYELRISKYRENDDVPYHSPSIPGAQRFHPFTGTVEKNSSTEQEGQDFDPFAQSHVSPPQYVSPAEEYRHNPADDNAAEMSVTITNGHPTEDFRQPAGSSHKDAAEDPFFSMIKKIKD